MFHLKKCLGRCPVFLVNEVVFGLTRDEDKFCRWQNFFLEVARAISQFKDLTLLRENKHSEFHNHEDSKSFQQKFAKYVSLLTK